jgi:hypothetical protein
MIGRATKRKATASGFVLALLLGATTVGTGPPAKVRAQSNWPKVDREDDAICKASMPACFPCLGGLQYACSSPLPPPWWWGNCRKGEDDTQGLICLESFLDCGAEIDCFNSKIPTGNRCPSIPVCQ